jgi:hypothetical protein
MFYTSCIISSIGDLPMDTTDDTVKKDAENASQDYDQGADTRESEHTVDEGTGYTDTRFNASSRYDSKFTDFSGGFLDSDEDW